jgi:HEAT repeat protein
LLRDGRALAVPLLAEVVRTADPLATPRAAAILGRYGAAAVDAVPALISLIESENPSATACNDALVQIGPAAAAGILHAVEGKDPSQLTREHWSVRALAAMGGSALSSIAQGFSSASVSARLVAVRACGELGPDGNAAGASVLKLCEDSDPRVRAAALGAATAVRVDPKQLQGRLEVAFKDPIPIVRMTAVQAVPSLGENGRVFAPALIAALKDDAPMVRQAALLAIGPGQAEAVPVLVETLSNPAMRDEVLAALGKLAAAAAPAIPHLVALYPQVEKRQRLAILEIISQAGANETPPLFSEAMKDTDPEIRAAAITGFVRAQSDKAAAANAALAMLSDAEQLVRRAAAASLGRLGESARNPATEPLISLLERDGDREFALDALRQLRIRTVPTILPLLDHRDERVRVFACERLARAGADAREAVPTLQKLAQSDAQPETVRREARRALAQIERR